MRGAHERPFGNDETLTQRTVRRRDENGLALEQPQQPMETTLHPSEGARLTFEEIKQSSPQESPIERHLPTIHRASMNPQGLYIWDQDGVTVVPDAPPDMIPPIHIINEQTLLQQNQQQSQPQTSLTSGYSMIRKLRKLKHAPGWGEIWSGIAFAPVRPNTFQAPMPGKFVAIKMLNKRVMDAYLQHGNGKPFVHRDLRHIDQEYLTNVMGVRDRENPYREMSRMETIGDNIHVLRAIECLQDDEFVYIIMPYACGRISLDTALFQRDQELSPFESRRFFIQILRILQYLEEQKIHHRDMSPDNFIFLEPDHLVVMDLAMSVQIPVDLPSGRRTLIRRLGPFGTPAFMCPEIFNDFELFDGVSADLWSAMLILYAMLTNIPLYRRPDAATDISYRFFIVAGAITREPQNELVVEILSDVMEDSGTDPEQQRNQHILLQQANAHLGLAPSVMDLFHNFFRINPAERWTLAQVMESDYVRLEDD